MANSRDPLEKTVIHFLNEARDREMRGRGLKPGEGPWADFHNAAPRNTGDGHRKITLNAAAVTCPRCLELMNAWQEDGWGRPEDVLKEVEKSVASQPTKEELARRYDAAPICPHCGGRQGFVMGTGDCGCDVDPN